VVAWAAAVGLLASGTAAVAGERVASSAARTPVVVFPAFHFTKLQVNVVWQFSQPGCPTTGSFEDWYGNDTTSSFSQVCRDRLMTFRYDSNPAKPMADRFSDQPGVSVEIKHYGRTESAPFYEPLYDALEGRGYVRNKDIRVAGYDSRRTPDQGGFLRRTISLIEQTYHDNGNTPVHLVGHSNGPLYAQYLLTHTSDSWRGKYIHGFTPLAGNWSGQGLLYPVLFTGLNVTDLYFPKTKENARSSALMYLSHPSSYMSAADPDVFGDREVVIHAQNTSRDYTPEDNLRLFTDARLPLAQQLAAYYTGFVKFAEPASFPDVDVYAEKGSGFDTMVGAVLPNLEVGQVLDPDTAELFLRDGDGNQEDITNDAIASWSSMPCHRFEFSDNPDVDHLSLAGAPAILGRLVDNLRRSKSAC
jgi:lysophospholipase-3